MIVWLKRYYDGAVRMGYNPPSQIPAGFLLDQVVIGGMFTIVDGMRQAPWSEVESILLEQRNILMRIDTGWAL